MGSACCVAAKETTITSGPSSERGQRNVRYSPSWSFRWENRRRVVGEETVNWSFDRVSRSSGLDIKSGTTVETANASEEGSPLDSSRTLSWLKSPISEKNSGILRPASSGQSSFRSVPAEVKEPTESPAVSYPSPMKRSPSVHSISSLSPSPLSAQNHLLASQTPSRWARRSPGHQLLRQMSDSRIPGHKSPNFAISEEPSFLPPAWSNESSGGSNRAVLDGWSLPAFSELMANSHRRERWSFDSDSLGFNREKIARSSGQLSSSVSIDTQTCGVCSKLLTEQSLWGSQKIMATNDLAVVAVLICGHVYHAECLENMTPEINKYEPTCPVCTFGEKQVVKLCEKAMRAEMDSKTGNKRWRKRILSSDLGGDSSVLVGRKSGGIEGKGPKMVSSSSMKSSFGKPFLRRHFSFGSKAKENHSSRKKAFFWSKSSKE